MDQFGLENRLSVRRPELVPEWSEKNLPLTPDDVTYGSRKKVWWKCPKGHEYQASIASRSGFNKTGCPYCSGNRVLAGFNDLATRFPDVAAEWSPRNGSLTPDQVSYGSIRKVWWICPKGHEYETLIASRTAGHGCPYCSSEKLLPGFNDFTSRHPELAKEWSKKNVLRPDQVPVKRAGKFWWKCKKCGGEYEMWLDSKARGAKCPYCSGRKVLPGFNDLATLKPELAQEWDRVGNGSLTPQKVLCSSQQSVWWHCPCGHTWYGKISDRARRGKTCPECEREFLAALPQLLVILYAGRKGMKAVIGSDKAIGTALEIWLPELDAAVELVAATPKKAEIQQVKAHLCRKRGIRYCLLQPSKDVMAMAEQVQEVLRSVHLHVKSDLAEDVSFAREQFLSLRKSIYAESMMGRN